MKILKIKPLSTSCAIILGSVIIGLSIFLTTWIFFGGNGNRQKLFIKSPTANKTAPADQMTPEQIKKLQEQRAEQLKKSTTKPSSTSTVE